MSAPIILLTGFEPFDGSPINPSAEVIQVLATTGIRGLRLQTCILPVVAETAPLLLRQQLDTLRPDFFIGLGEARGRSALNIEQIGANELDFRMPDNSGATLAGQSIVEDGPSTYTSTFPAEAIREAIRQRGIPAVFSSSAGRYLCNQVLYTGLHWAATHSPTTQVGFIHLPSLPEQMALSDTSLPTMALALQVEALRAALAQCQINSREGVSQESASQI